MGKTDETKYVRKIFSKHLILTTSKQGCCRVVVCSGCGGVIVIVMIMVIFVVVSVVLIIYKDYSKRFIIHNMYVYN